VASSAPHVVDVTEANFEAEVLAASASKLIVVDFWATWCGPCRTLGPILEQVAASYGGAFKLAKVDVDRSPQLAAYFQAQSIPMVVAIYQGQLVHSFTGALPRQEIERWLQRIFEAIGVDAKPAAAAEKVPTDPAQARAWFRRRLAEDDGDQAARLALGKLLMSQGEVEEAETLLTAIPVAAPEYNPAQAALQLKELLAELGEAGGEAAVRARHAAAPEDPEARYLVAVADGAAGRFAVALEALVGLVAAGPAAVRDRARGRAQLLLAAAGRGDDGVEAQRRRLARLLF